MKTILTTTCKLPIWRGWLIVIGLIVANSAHSGGQGRYLTVEDFLQTAFATTEPVMATLWIDAELRAPIEQLLGHPFDGLRVRYWQADGRTAWIFNEIGKEQPITIGVSVQDAAVEVVRVLEFRESRGWEVRHPFFTDQFTGVQVTAEQRFSRSIDGITGATLSVAAVSRVVRLALFLTHYTERQHS
jgi:hypothetical protein